MNKEIIKGHIKTLSEEAMKNEMAVLNKEKLTAKELIDIWQYQGKVQQTIMWLQNVEKNRFPAIVKQLGEA